MPPDGRITPRAGLQLVAKLDALLSITGTISQMAPSVKLRRRSLGYESPSALYAAATVQ